LENKVVNKNVLFGMFYCLVNVKQNSKFRSRTVSDPQIYLLVINTYIKRNKQNFVKHNSSRHLVGNKYLILEKFEILKFYFKIQIMWLIPRFPKINLVPKWFWFVFSVRRWMFLLHPSLDSSFPFLFIPFPAFSKM